MGCGASKSPIEDAEGPPPKEKEREEKKSRVDQGENTTECPTKAEPVPIAPGSALLKDPYVPESLESDDDLTSMDSIPPSPLINKRLQLPDSPESFSGYATPERRDSISLHKPVSWKTENMEIAAMLRRRLAQRPSIQELKEKNIIREEERLSRQEISERLSKLLDPEIRTPRSHLSQRGILRDSPHKSSRINLRQQVLRKEQAAHILNSYFRNRPSTADLDPVEDYLQYQERLKRYRSSRLESSSSMARMLFMTETPTYL